jgi:hypothetical protein
MKVANSFKGFDFDLEKAYKNESGKLVVDAKCKCDRCGGSGVYASRVENGEIVPHPAFGGVCLKCDGRGMIYKTIRVYTDEEFEKLEARNKREAEKKAAERETKIKVEYETKSKEWLSKNGFNKNMVTYVYYLDNSYDVKDELKNAGFRFNKTLLWHCAEIPESYEDKVIAINFADIASMSAWGEGMYKVEARAFVDTQIKEARPASRSSWIGEEGEKLSVIPVTLVSIRPFESRFGFSQVVKFLNGDNVITWFTATNIKYEIGDSLLLSGTVKQHSEYNDELQTVMTRCKLLPQH